MVSLATTIRDRCVADPAAPPFATAGKEDAMAAIRDARNAPYLPLDYRAAITNPYTDDDELDVYEDDSGNEYWVEPERCSLVHMGPRTGLHSASRQTREDDRLPVAALRDIALDAAERVAPGFLRTRAEYHPYEDNRRRELYLFRWDDASGALLPALLPRFIQVALFSDGMLAGLVNTLAL